MHSYLEPCFRIKYWQGKVKTISKAHTVYILNKEKALAKGSDPDQSDLKGAD